MQRKESPLDNAMKAASSLGVNYAEHLAKKGAKMSGYGEAESKQLADLFNEHMEKAWTERYGKSPTQIEKEALEEAFGRSFYMMLGSITR